MMRHRLRARRGDERGFTLIELLVVMILVGVLAAIALAVFLNQRQRAADSKAKSNVTNIVRTIQACQAGLESNDDFRDCDSTNELQERSIKIDPAVSEIPGNCGSASQAAANPGNAPGSGYDVRIVQAGPSCYTVVGTSDSGNRFSYAHRDNGTVERDCRTHGSTGCPTNGEWAG